MSTHPLTRKGVLLLPPLDPRGETRTLARERVGGPNSEEGTDTLVLCVYYNPSTGIRVANPVHDDPWRSIQNEPDTGFNQNEKQDLDPHQSDANSQHGWQRCVYWEVYSAPQR